MIFTFFKKTFLNFTQTLSIAMRECEIFDDRFNCGICMEMIVLNHKIRRFFGTFFRNIQIDRELIVKARPCGYYIKV